VTGGEPDTGAGSALWRREPGVTAPLSVRQSAARAVRKGPPADPVLLGRVHDALLRRLSGDPVVPGDARVCECVTSARWQVVAR
jgi:hypothetical protein